MRKYFSPVFLSILGSSDGNVSACNGGDLGLIPGSGRSPGEGNGNPLQYSCLENPMDTGAWQATVHGVEESRTRLSDFTRLHYARKQVIYVKEYQFSSVAQLCLTLCNPVDDTIR